MMHLSWVLCVCHFLLDHKIIAIAILLILLDYFMYLQFLDINDTILSRCPNIQNSSISKTESRKFLVKD